MKQFTSLLKLHLKLKYTFPELRYDLRANPKKAWRAIGLGLLITFVICYVLAFYSFIAYYIIKAAASVNMAGVFLAIGIMSTQIVILIFGIFYMMGLYHMKDMQLLASLPITQGKVFAVKFIMVLISEIGTFVLFLVPIIIIYGLQMGASYDFYLKALVVVLLGAFIPMAVSSLLAALLVRTSVFTRKKDLIAIIGGFIFFTAIFAMNMLISTNLQGLLMNGGVANLQQEQRALINAIATGFPPSAWAARALIEPGLAGLGSLGLFALVSLAGTGVAAFIAGRMYFSGALAQLESARSKPKDVSRSYGKVSSPVNAIFIKEWKVILRSPIYALNSLFGIIIGPMMLFFLTIGSGRNKQGMEQLGRLLSGQSLIASLALCGLMIFVGAMNPAAATVISREGKAFWIAKMVPVSAKQQIKGKFYFGCSIALLGVLATAVLGGIILKLPILSVMAGAIVAILLGTAVSAISVLLDMAKPKLLWESEQQAIKQNMNAFFATMLGFLVILSFGYFGFRLVTSGMSAVLIWGILIAVALCLAILFERIMNMKAKKAFERIDHE